MVFIEPAVPLIHPRTVLQIYIYIYELVDSLCRDGADLPIRLYTQNPSKLPNTEVLSMG